MNNIQQLNKKAFKAERAKYLDQINQLLDTTIIQSYQLNRNLEQLIYLGNNFSQAGEFWQEFINNPTNNNN